jgi:hypothetical protein
MEIKIRIKNYIPIIIKNTKTGMENSDFSYQKIETSSSSFSPLPFTCVLTVHGFWPRQWKPQLLQK